MKNLRYIDVYDIILSDNARYVNMKHPKCDILCIDNAPQERWEIPNAKKNKGVIDDARRERKRSARERKKNKKTREH